jgi:DNA-binding transcriptional regulator YiaG
MKTKTKNFEVLVPNLDGTGVAERVTVQIPLKWDDELEVWVLTPEAHQIIEDTKARHMGLLLPAQFRELRERYGFSQKEMGELFQAGEKSWTRWETGNQRPSRMVSLIIRALYEGAISINYLLQKAGKPPLTTAAKAPHQVFSQLLKEYATSAPLPIAAVAVTVGTGKTTFLQQLERAQPHALQMLGHPPASVGNRLVGLAAPSHAYPQPRLTNLAIKEGVTEG